MRFTIPLAVIVVGTLSARTTVAPAEAPSAHGEVSLAAVLDDFHAAAAAADGTRYFAHVAPEAVFLGTDATERCPQTRQIVSRPEVPK